MRKLRTFCGKVTEFLFLVFKQSVSNSRDFGFQKYIWSDITAPPLSPPKNPIKREKKKLVCSSEREDFIKSGEDQFVRILRVLLVVVIHEKNSKRRMYNIVFLYNYAVRLL